MDKQKINEVIKLKKLLRRKEQGVQNMFADELEGSGGRI